MSKTYDWMAGKRGNAHFCEREGVAGAPKAVCGGKLEEPEPVGAERNRCVTCIKMEKQIHKYLEYMKAMKGKD